MKGIIDFHTHAFPDQLAARAISTLAHKSGIKAYLDGSLSSLTDSMDKAGIYKSVVCSIATKPAQFDPIIEWSRAIRSERIIPLLSVHPSDPDCAEKLKITKNEGFNGIKLHPYYQDFMLDEDRMLRLFELTCKENLIAVVHTGYDIGFPRIRRADPKKIVKVSRLFPELKLVTTHLGAWEHWQEVESLISGKPIYMDISFSLEYLSSDPVRNIIANHPKEYLLFGTDSPWTEQDATLAKFRELKLGEENETAILYGNARRLLDSA
jgi:uncharacterized protein